VEIKKQDLALIEEKIKNINDFRANYQEIKENLEKIGSLFVESRSPVDFISFLENSAQRSQIKTNISASKLRQDQTSIWSYLTFDIEAFGSAPNFFKFLEKMEAGPYLLEIRSLNIKKISEDDLKRIEFEGIFLGDVRGLMQFKVFSY